MHLVDRFKSAEVCAQGQEPVNEADVCRQLLVTAVFFEIQSLRSKLFFVLSWTLF